MGSGNRILVTGGAGFIGTHLVRRLRECGERVTVLDCLSEQVHGGKPWTPPEDVEFLQGDVRDRRTLRRALAGADRVVHLAAETGVGQSAYEIERYVDVNQRGTAVLLEECAEVRHRLRGLILASSRAVYGEGRYRCPEDGEVYPRGRSRQALAAGRWEPVCPTCGADVAAMAAVEDQRLLPASVYAVTKLGQEQLVDCFVRAYTIPCIALRLQNVYGPGQALGNPYTGIASIFATRLLKGNHLEVYEDGAPSRDFVYISDVVRALELSLGSLGPSTGPMRVYNVGSGRAASVLTLARLLEDLLKRSRSVRVTGKYRVGDVRHSRADLSLAGTELGYSPCTRLRAGVGSLVKWVARQDSVNDHFEHMADELASRGLLAIAEECPVGSRGERK